MAVSGNGDVACRNNDLAVGAVVQLFTIFHLR